MRNSIKKMVLMTMAVTVIVASLAAPAIAKEQQQVEQQQVEQQQPEPDAGENNTENFLPPIPGPSDLCKNNPQLPWCSTGNPAPPPPADKPKCGFGEVRDDQGKCHVEYYICKGEGGVVDKTTTPPKCVPKPPEKPQPEPEGCQPDQQHPGKPYGCCPEGEKKGPQGLCVKDPEKPQPGPEPEDCPPGQKKGDDGKCHKPSDGKLCDWFPDDNRCKPTTPGGGSGGGTGTGGGSGGWIVTSINGFKENLPAPVAKSLPNTGGGWLTLALAGGALLAAGGFLIRRFSR